MNQKDKEYLIKKSKLIHQLDITEDGILSVLDIAFTMGEAHQMKEEIKKTEQRISTLKQKIHI